MNTTCFICGAPLSQPATGRPRHYCGPTCRQQAHRAMLTHHQKFRDTPSATSTTADPAQNARRPPGAAQAPSSDCWLAFPPGTATAHAATAYHAKYGTPPLRIWIGPGHNIFAGPIPAPAGYR